MTTTNLDVVVDGASLASSSYSLRPRNRPAEGLPWEYILLDDATSPSLGSGPPTVSITAIWGWVDDSDAQAIPGPVKRAAVLLGTRFFMRNESPMGVGGSAQMGNELTLAETDPDVARMVRRFWRLGQAAGFA